MHISLCRSVVLREQRSDVIRCHIMTCVDLRNQRCKSLNKITVRGTRVQYFTMKRLQAASKCITEVNTDTHLKCFLKKFALSIS